jgi:hypothetical protein
MQVVCVHTLRARHPLSIQRMLELPRQLDGHRLVHLVAHDDAGSDLPARSRL